MVNFRRSYVSKRKGIFFCSSCSPAVVAVLRLPIIARRMDNANLKMLSVCSIVTSRARCFVLPPLDGGCIADVMKLQKQHIVRL